MKNSQVAVLSFVMLLAAVIIAGGNFWLVRSSGAFARDTTAAARPRRHLQAMTLRQTFHHRHDAQEQGQRLLHRLP